MAVEDPIREMLRTIVREEVRAAVAELGTKSTPATEEPEWLDDRQLAQWLGLGQSTLQQLRAKGEGPPFVKLARRVRYFKPDVRAWLETETRGRVTRERVARRT